MNFGPVEPLRSRSHFRVRGTLNVLVLGASFIIAATILTMVSEMMGVGMFGQFLLYIPLIGTVYYFYVLWEKRPIKLKCKACDRVIQSNTPWVCGYKQCKNLKADDFPFLHQCEHCGSEPKAYRCHHEDCGQLIFLTEDRLKTNFAFCLNSPRDLSKDDLRIATQQNRMQEREETEHSIKKSEMTIIMSDLDTRLLSIKKRKELERMSATARAEALCEDYCDEVLAIDEAVLKKKEANAAKFKDADLERRNAVVDAWAIREKTKAED